MKDLGKIVAGVSFLLALLAAGFLVLAPCAVTGQRVTSGIPNGPSTRQATCSSLIEATGGRVIAAILIPVVLAGLAVILSGTKLRAGIWICAAIVLAFSILTGFSIGLLFFPSAMALLIAAILQLTNIRPPPPPPDAAREE